MALINIKFPLQKGRNGYPLYNETVEDATRENVKMVLFTPKGTRINRPNFGTDVQKHLFNPQNTNLKSSIRIEVHNALLRWVRNIRIDAIEAYFQSDLRNSQYSSVVIDDQTAFVVVKYTIIAGQLQFPNQIIGLTFSN